MTTQRSWLIGFYALLAAAGLVATWSQNLQIITPGMGPLDVYLAFVEQAKANPASRSITIDIGFFLLAASAFMVIEARRLGVRFVWLYIVLGLLIAISFTFPLFMIARERRLAQAANADAAWSLTVGDVAGLALLTALVGGLCWLVLN